jgi:hypothetical protein
MRRLLYRGPILALVLFLFTSGGARAGVLLTSARVNNPFNFSYAPGATSTVPVALNDAGATSLSFSTATSQTVVVTFSAECSGDTAGTWVVAVVVIDGVIATGDGGFRYTRLCAGAEPQKAISRTVFKSLAAGNHTIQVIAAIDGPPYVSPAYQGTFEKIVLTVTN